MANLTLAHTGNMGINDAYISNDRLYTSFGKNDTGAVTGFSFNPSQGSEFICGATYTINAYPRFSGTVLTETFVVSGTDTLGVRKSDSSVLMQNYDTDLTHYDIAIGSVGGTVISSSVTSDVVSVEFQIDDDEYAELDIQPGSGQVFTYPIDNIKVLPGPVVTATSINLIVDSAITNTGVAYVEYDPTGATVEIAYSIDDTDIATIDSNGNITVLQNGVVTVCAIDIISGLRDCKQVTMTYDVEPVTGGTITSLSIVVPNSITGYGYASSSYEPSTAEVELHYYSNLPEVASINETTGDIIVHSDGNVTFCVEDTVSGLRDCKNVAVIKTVYINSIEIVVGGTVMGAATASTNYSPSSANTFNFVYSSSDPSIATIDPDTGEIDVLSPGQVTFCVRDTYTNLSSCKTVNSYGYPKVCVTYNTDNEDFHNYGGWFVCTPIYEDTINDERWFSKAECDGVDITNELIVAGSNLFYNFPEGSSKTICYTLKEFYYRAGAGDVHVRTGFGIPYESFVYGVFGSNVSAISFSTIPPDSAMKPYIGAYLVANSRYLESVVIPDGWMTHGNPVNGYEAFGIPTGVFSGCTSLKTASLGSDFIHLYNTFDYCSSLSSVTVSNNVIEIEKDAFSRCYALKSFNPPRSVKTYGDGAFVRSGLTGFTFNDGVERLGVSLFAWCDSLLYINNYPSQRAYIPQEMCKDCTSLTGFTIGENVTRIDPNAFSGCTGMQELVVLPETPPTIGGYNTIGSTGYTFPIKVHCSSYWNYYGDPGWSKYKHRLQPIEQGCNTKLEIECTFNITSTTVATTVCAYKGADYFKKIHLEDGTVIPINPSTYSSTTYLFGETGLTKVYYEIDVLDLNAGTPGYSCFDTIPELIGIKYPEGVLSAELSVSYCGYYPKNCENLSSITLPSTLTGITLSGRQNTSVSEIYSYPETVPTGNVDFTGFAATGTLYYPSGSDYSSWIALLPSGWTGSPTL